jgi:hypothetical protein
VLGDSFVEAFQVEQDSTFIALVEDRLDRTLPLRVELMNLGRSGMSRTEQFLVLQNDVMAFEPYMVAVVSIPRNDIADINPATADAGHLTLATDSPDPTYAANYRLNKMILAAMADYCGARGVRFLLVCADDVFDPEEEARCRALDSSFDASFFDRDLRAFADSLAINYVGLQGPFRRAILAGRGPLHWARWNYAGHRVVANELYDVTLGIVARGQSH